MECVVRALATWSGAIAGLLLIVAGGLIPAAIPFADADGWSLRPLGITLQVPALLLAALVAGPRSALLAAVAYLSVGLFQLPVFQEGGGAGLSARSRLRLPGRFCAGGLDHRQARPPKRHG